MACAGRGEIMVHSQIGYRDFAKSCLAYQQIWQDSVDKGARVDRYGICLDWSMGFCKADRDKAQQGTGLILPDADAFAELTAAAPVAPHFGDFVLGMPAALENTCAALRAGSTSIGNLGQYFTFRLPGWHNDVLDTESTVKALVVMAAQPQQILVHSNLDDGFAALFTDLACSLGAVRLEQYVVEQLIGGSVSHCYGHSFSEPYKRLVFQLGLAQITNAPGTMIYGNTMMYKGSGNDNYAAMANYLGVDIAAQLHQPTGHAINPVPITEAMRIPDIDEVIDAAVFAHRMIEQADKTLPLLDFSKAKKDADTLVTAAGQFKTKVLNGLSAGGIDINNPFETMLALRRIGAKRLEEVCGPGKVSKRERRGRVPTLLSSTIAQLEDQAEQQVAKATHRQRDQIQKAELLICVCATDVHEYGKILLEEVLQRFDVKLYDAGVHADPLKLASIARAKKFDAIAISTYNGVALDYLKQLRNALKEQGIDCPILMGGKTNQIPADSNSSLPVDVSQQLVEEGAIVCRSMSELVEPLASLARTRLIQCQNNQ